MKEIDSVTLFMNRNYKVSISFALSELCMHHINYVFDTEAERSLPREDLAEPD